MYAVGGHDASEHLGNMEMFDPLTNKWMMMASMNTKRYADTRGLSSCSYISVLPWVDKGLFWMHMAWFEAQCSL